MKILSIIPVMGVGGAEVVAATLATDARARGHEALVASGGGFRADELTAAGVPHHTVPLDSRRPIRLARSAARVRRLCLEWRPDLVHAHNVKAAVVARLALVGTPGQRPPVLTTLHGVAESDQSRAAHLLRRATDHLVAVSDHVADTVAGHGFPLDRVSVIENAVTPPHPHDRAAARARLGLPPDAVVGLCLARLAEQKRHDLLIDAWQRLDAPGILLLAGDGPTRDRVADLVAAGPATRDIRLLGARTDVDWLLAAADYLVLPTDWEGLPISVLEAMSAGVPVLASRVGGVLDTLGEGIRLVTPGDVAALAAGLTELVESASERRHLGDAGRRLVAQRYPMSAMLEAYDERYALLTGRARVQGRARGSRAPALLVGDRR